MTFQHYRIELAIVDLQSIKNMIDLHRKWARREFELAQDSSDKACRAKVLAEVDSISMYVDSVLQRAESQIAEDANEKAVHMR